MKRSNRLINFVYKILQMPKIPTLIQGQRIRLHTNKLFYTAGVGGGGVVWIETHHILKLYRVTDDNYLFTVICNSIDSHFVKNGDIVYLPKEEFNALQYT